MATFLGASLLGKFSAIFIFLLVYSIVWGLLTWMDPFGTEDTKTGLGIYGIIALAVAFLIVVSRTATYIISFVTPWFVVFAIVVFFLLFVVKMFNVSDDDLRDVIGKYGSIYTWIIVISVVIVFFSLANAFGQPALEATEGPSDSSGKGQAQQGGPDEVIGPSQSQDGKVSSGEGSEPAGGSGEGPTPGTPGATATGDFNTNFINTLVHPKVLGLLFLLLLGSFTVMFLSKRVKEY